MKKGENNITDSDVALLQKMLVEVAEYEAETITLPAPKTLMEMVELKLFQRKMTQADFTRQSGLDLPKVNQIINGKRLMDISFLKAIYSELDIPAHYCPIKK